jgi:DNA polymerase III delta prime subunit
MVNPDFTKTGFPFVETSLSRHLTIRLKTTQDARSYMIFSGNWGVGKSETLYRFARTHKGKSLLLTVERGARKVGTLQIHLMEQIIRMLREVLNKKPLKTYPHGFHSCQEALLPLFCEYFDVFYQHMPFDDNGPKLLLIFDEAQFLSRLSIEMLRAWGDGTSASVPYPMAIALVGNDEFDVKPTNRDESQISGAVDSRALFVEKFGDYDLLDDDLLAIMHSRGLTNPDCTDRFIAYFSQDGMRRDLRRLDNFMIRVSHFCPLANATPDIIQTVLES